jgi:hypothetical protein
MKAFRIPLGTTRASARHVAGRRRLGSPQARPVGAFHSTCRKVASRAVDGSDDAETSASQTASLSSVSDRCESGDPDFDLCAVSFEESEEDRGIDAKDGGVSEKGPAAPASAVAEVADPSVQVGNEATTTVSLRPSAVEEAYERGKWLVGLLILQSSSSFVLDKYQDLIRDHLVVTLFLTMLVGAGGNAGNQSAIKVIRGMATGSIAPTLRSLRQVMKQQIAVAFILGTSLSAAGVRDEW